MNGSAGPFLKLTRSLNRCQCWCDKKHMRPCPQRRREATETRLQLELFLSLDAVVFMSSPLGPEASASPQVSTANRLLQSKKKGCKQKKCSNWKGGKCHCGRD